MYYIAILTIKINTNNYYIEGYYIIIIMEINDKYTLQLIKGYDKNNIKFSAFVIIKNNESFDKFLNKDTTQNNISTMSSHLIYIIR